MGNKAYKSINYTYSQEELELGAYIINDRKIFSLYREMAEYIKIYDKVDKYTDIIKEYVDEKYLANEIMDFICKSDKKVGGICSDLGYYRKYYDKHLINKINIMYEKVKNLLDELHPDHKEEIIRKINVRTPTNYRVLRDGRWLRISIFNYYDLYSVNGDY